MKVLVIEDDPVMAGIIRLTLESENYFCDIYDLGRDGVKAAKKGNYDIVILDLMLPDIDGYEVLSRLRASMVHAPVLILSGFAEVQDEIKAERGGVNDFLPKPFNRQHLVERVRMLVSNSEIVTVPIVDEDGETVIQTGHVKINITSRSVEANGREVQLSPKEYRILELLSLRKGKIIPKANFIIHLYDAVDVPESPEIIDNFVDDLRSKLSQATDGEYYIDDIPDRGYVLCDPVPAAMVSRGPRQKVTRAFA